MNNAKISGERRVFLVNGNPFEGKRGLYFGPYKNFCRNTSHSVSAKKDPVITRSAILVLRRLRQTTICELKVTLYCIERLCLKTNKQKEQNP